MIASNLTLKGSGKKLEFKKTCKRSSVANLCLAPAKNGQLRLEPKISRNTDLTSQASIVLVVVVVSIVESQETDFDTERAMSMPTRLSLRLPSASTRWIEAKSPRVSTGRIQQRRWAQRPPAKRREWAQIPKKDDETNVSAQRSQRDDKIEEHQPQEQQVGKNTQLAATLAQSDTSDLVTEVSISDDPDGIIPPDHPALALLGNSSLVIQRQIEMMNIMIGFEQANRYIIMDGQGQTLGYIAEQDHGIGRTMARQVLRTHRSFTTHIFDAQEREVLRVHRPFTYINSRIRVYDPIPEGGYKDTETSTALQGTSASSAMNSSSTAQVSPLKLDEMRIIGEAQQQWAPLRRKYNLFTYRSLDSAPSTDTKPRIESGDQPNTETTALTERNTPDQEIEAGMAQFAHVNEPFLSWDFTLRDENQNVIGSVNRNFVGFAREIFTDTGVYALRMDSAAQASAEETPADATAMTLDQRAVMLATAVSIDFDYFSRHSRAGGPGFMPFLWPMGGGAAEGGAAGAGAGTAGTATAGEAAAGVGATEAATGAIGSTAARGAATAAGGESAIAGAGTMAGYEAMQPGVYGNRGGADDASPQSAEPPPPESIEQMENKPGNDDVWGEGADPWSGGDGGGGEGGGGGWLDFISEFFKD